MKKNGVLILLSFAFMASAFAETAPADLRCETRGDLYMRNSGEVVLVDHKSNLVLFSSSFDGGHEDLHHNEVMAACLNVISAAVASGKFVPMRASEFFSTYDQSVELLSLKGMKDLSCSTSATFLLLPMGMSEGIVKLKSGKRIVFAEAYASDDYHGRTRKSALRSCEKLVEQAKRDEAAIVNFRSEFI